MPSLQAEMASLPDPDPEAKAHSQRLSTIITREIDKAGGSIGFDHFMRLALYEPRLGYYRAGIQKFGNKGDFVTAPEVSPLFSQCLARQCAPVLKAIAGGSILEFGAGTGIMAAEILESLEALDGLPQNYYILELSAELRQRQIHTLQTRVPHLSRMVTWLERLPKKGFRGVVLGNEVLDAMPVRCFKLGGSGVLERRVGRLSGNRFGWCDHTADEILHKNIEYITRQLSDPLAPGYCSEFNPQLEAWIKTLNESLEQAVVILIDYGYPRGEYYHPKRYRGTLLCHYRHRAHEDPFFFPGLQDISANVDFTAIAESSIACGMTVLGYTSQAHFLLASGLEEIFARVTSDSQRLRYSQQIKRLTLPSEMGERFQVIVLGKAFNQPLRGLKTYDMRYRL